MEGGVLWSKSIKVLEDAEMLIITVLTTAAETKLTNLLQNEAKGEFWKWIHFCYHWKRRKCVKPKILIISQGENIPTIHQNINAQIFTKCAIHLIKTIHTKPHIILTSSQQIQAINISTIRVMFSPLTHHRIENLSTPHSAILLHYRIIPHSSNLSINPDWVPTVQHIALC